MNDRLEELEEIKTKVRNTYEPMLYIPFDDVQLLIERIEELEQQNQRYREALEKLADHIDPYVSKIANEALEDNQ